MLPFSKASLFWAWNEVMLCEEAKDGQPRFPPKKLHRGSDAHTWPTYERRLA